MNKLVLNFTPCTTQPPRGYNIKWRIAGSGDVYTNAGNFFISPAVFYDHVNPAGTMYEGFITSDTGSGMCNNIPWTTTESGEVQPEYTIDLYNPIPCNGINSRCIINNGVPGDIVTVRASFGGVMAKIGNSFVRADLTISSPDGTSDFDSSACYSDTASHGFNIVADTIITMSGDTAFVDLVAVVHNSSEVFTNVAVTIIDVNGEEKLIAEIGCKGNSSTGGTC